LRITSVNSNPNPATCSRRRFLQLAAGTVLTLLLPGCARQRQEPLPQPTVGRIDTQPYRKQPPWHLARSGRGDVNPWMVMLSAHIEYAAVEKHRHEFAVFRTASANWDPNKQIEDIQGLLAQGPDLLLVDPMDTAVVARGVRSAVDAGVPVVLVSSYVSNAPYLAWLAQPEKEHASRCVDWLLRNTAPRQILVLSNRPASGSNPLWVAGIQEQMATHSEVSVHIEPCHWSSAGAEAATGALLGQGERFDGVIVRNGLIARGVVDALLERGLPIPPIAGADDWNGWLGTAKDHGVQFLALTGGANIGLHAVEMATQVLAGEGVEAYSTLPLHAFDHTELDSYHRPDLSEHYWAVHDLPEAWIERMFSL